MSTHRWYAVVSLLAFLLGAAAGRIAATSPGRRLAPMAGAGPDRPVQGGRAPAAMAASGPPLLWTASNLGTGYGSVAVKGDRIFVQSSNGKQSIVASLNRADGKGVWSKALGPAGRQRSGIRVRGDADRGRRPALRADRERRLVVSESRRRHRGLAAQHPQGLQRPEHPVAAQRIAAGRRQHGDRDAGRTERRHGGARQDDGRHDLDREGAERRGRLRVG